MFYKILADFKTRFELLLKVYKTAWNMKLLTMMTRKRSMFRVPGIIAA